MSTIEDTGLRSSEPDLKVILGSDGEEIKWYHAPTLAHKSKYIDTMLSTPMKEAETSTITFPDISPELWDQAMEFLDSPVAARRMKISDVLKVAKFYDKYEFIEGTKLCDDVLLDYFRFIDRSATQTDVDLFIQSVVVAYESNLMESIESNGRWIHFLDYERGPS